MHDEGIVHRDIKLVNIQGYFLDSTGFYYFIDQKI